MIKSCYIHIPFCNKICSYCDFPKLLYNVNYVDKYLDSLEKEIKSCKVIHNTLITTYGLKYNEYSTFFDMLLFAIFSLF